MARCCAILLIVLGAGLPVGHVAAQVGLFGNPCCQTCAAPVAQCTCQTVRPVVETCYRKEQVVTYQNVCETQLRQERVVQRVPVTRYRNVTVDEGCYQMVWVPKPVTKTIAFQDCEDRVTTRTVPVTVQRTIPRVSTRIVPQQTVRYVTQTHTMAMPVPQQPICPTCAAPSFTAALSPVALPSVAAMPTTPTVATIPPVPTYATAHREPLIEQRRLPKVALNDGPVPDPNFGVGMTQTASADARLGDWQPIRSRTETADSRYDRFGPAPSAASVWQATSGMPVRR